ncbi:PQQ-dependent sugar dehydrogenase [Ramlibacter henchirensis]|uniref:PQQ-dependent sugar dehydrogenase n=1 Tax=Ramlibacter henchirensis TaxID=204072 RepID=A0A4Z0C7N0_9BURK|nr:PQQ-dependent sugar dehydrogenase [Ramlibacter henchirensis]TFZ06460.1 PQQ-dependent sugar dehydrogenase [Ramlibacter henchirensis]
MRPCSIRALAAVAVAAAFVSLIPACGGGGGGGPDPSAQQAFPFPVTQRASGLVVPWGMAFLPDGRLLVTERLGRMQLFDVSGQSLGAISGVPPVLSSGQGGLLDVVLDPAFASNRRIYFSFAEADPANPALNGTAVGRAVLDPDARALSGVTVIWRQLPKVASSAHFGSRLVFDRSGHLFVTLGDRLLDGERGFAQDPTRGHGKVMRITTDGAPAPGNPAWGVAGALPEVWTLGHRNVQGAALHPSTGELWTSEHGAQGGDEINRLRAGANYGWPLASRSQEYETLTPVGPASLPGMEDPLWVWETITGSPWTGGAKSSIAPAGIAFYTGSAMPQWQGNLFVTALAGRALWRLTLDGDRVTSQERLLAQLNERLRDVEVGPDGALYLLAESGRVLRFGP